MLVNRHLPEVLRDRQEFDNRAIRVVQEYYLKGLDTKSTWPVKFNLSLNIVFALILKTARAIVAGREHRPVSTARCDTNRPQEQHHQETASCIP